ncbi:hypothetical protein [Glutamicibacter sp.]|uniref:hypothetical protein n=1 Tax=Glutamicibacter sp. TaxID=1931995 RepID=UPI002FD8C1F6
MVSDHVYPITVTIPTSGIMAGAAHWPLTDIPESFSIFSISGYLRVLVSGTFTVTLRDMKDAPNLLFGQIDFTAAGDFKGTFPLGGSEYILQGPTSGIRFSVPNVGVGALDCIVTVYGRLRY